MIDNKEQYERTLQWLDKFKTDLERTKSFTNNELWFMKAYRESLQSQIESLMEEIKDYEEENQAWENYLISIGVTDLTNEEEISQKLDEVERQHSDYEKNILEALEEINFEENRVVSNNDIRGWIEEIMNEGEEKNLKALQEISDKENKPLESINRKDIESWLLSLGD